VPQFIDGATQVIKVVMKVEDVAENWVDAEGICAHGLLQLDMCCVGAGVLWRRPTDVPGGPRKQFIHFVVDKVRHLEPFGLLEIKEVRSWSWYRSHTQRLSKYVAAIERVAPHFRHLSGTER